jgi:hypothetical protein
MAEPQWALTETRTWVSLRRIIFGIELLALMKRIGMNVDWSEGMDRLRLKLQTMAAGTQTSIRI